MDRGCTGGVDGFLGQPSALFEWVLQPAADAECEVTHKQALGTAMER